MSDYGCRWLNNRRQSDDWKVKLFERISDGKQIAIYDRERGFKLRLEEYSGAVAGVGVLAKCPKSDALDISLSKFKKDYGVCVETPELSSVKELLKQYFASDSVLLETLKKEFQQAVEASTTADVSVRQQRLQNAPKKPITRTVTVTLFVRNSDVVAERLYIANGVCERCKEPAPFARASNGEPYLEVHHIDPLSPDGEEHHCFMPKLPPPDALWLIHLLTMPSTQMSIRRKDDTDRISFPKTYLSGQYFALAFHNEDDQIV